MKDPVAGQDWRQEEKGMTEDEMIGWHHQLYGHEFEQVPGVGDGQGSLECCSPRSCKDSDMTEWLNWTDECLCLYKKLDQLMDLPAVYEILIPWHSHHTEASRTRTCIKYSCFLFLFSRIVDFFAHFYIKVLIYISHWFIVVFRLLLNFFILIVMFAN